MTASFKKGDRVRYLGEFPRGEWKKNADGTYTVAECRRSIAHPEDKTEYVYVEGAKRNNGTSSSQFEIVAPKPESAPVPVPFAIATSLFATLAPYGERVDIAAKKLEERALEAANTASRVPVLEGIITHERKLVTHWQDEALKLARDVDALKAEVKRLDAKLAKANRLAEERRQSLVRLTEMCLFRFRGVGAIS